MTRIVCLSAGAILLLLAGCTLEDQTPTEIRPPATPTDVREVQRIDTTLVAYRRDQRLIRSTRNSCSRGLPAGFYRRVCGPEVRPLVAQQRTHLREGLAGLARRVGVACAAALERVLAVPSARAGKPFAIAARVCRREYRRAARGA